jgi:hypothetical protein
MAYEAMFATAFRRGGVKLQRDRGRPQEAAAARTEKKISSNSNTEVVVAADQLVFLQPNELWWSGQRGTDRRGQRQRRVWAEMEETGGGVYKRNGRDRGEVDSDLKIKFTFLLVS